jgi:hypothetical protein
MIVYEVNLTMRNTIFKKNKEWLIDHFHKMVIQNKFIKLQLFTVKNMDPLNDNDLRETKITAQYYVCDFAVLQSYFAKKARQMRDQVLETLDCHYSVSRRILECIEIFENKEAT